MKCFEIEKQIDLLLDGEIDSRQKEELKAHLVICESCRAELELRQKTQSLLKVQPFVLPVSAFDKKMLQTFENTLKNQQKDKNNWLSTIFAIPKPIMIGALATFIFGLGIMFLLGRMSVASPPQLNVANVEKTPEKIVVTVTPTPEIREVVVTKPEIRTITKYVEIPVVKERVVTKNIYRNQTQNAPLKEEKEILAESNKQKEQEEIAKQFNLKDLQPVANVTYKIIRKGENNEK